MVLKDSSPEEYKFFSFSFLFSHTRTCVLFSFPFFSSVDFYIFSDRYHVLLSLCLILLLSFSEFSTLKKPQIFEYVCFIFKVNFLCGIKFFIDASHPHLQRKSRMRKNKVIFEQFELFRDGTPPCSGFGLSR